MTGNTGAELEADYVVVGAGAVGLAFVDVLLDETTADIILIDRRTEPGGHWRDAYPFVRLHNVSALYGVNSTPLGERLSSRTVPRTRTALSWVTAAQRAKVSSGSSDFTATHCTVPLPSRTCKNSIFPLDRRL